ncbi:hypothetical protein LIER_11647 [Lithospermum erythrorhizon]|uniref:Protein kinase domain-containing protein n=1 Tax=Lithospermum erythrorhizon TaxID=34254 RepID=A0AAV3PPA5_LITER
MEKSYKTFLILLLFLFSLIVPMPSLEITKTNITTDEAALLALKTSITSDPFQMLAKNWTSGTSVCSWIGISCGARHRRVVALDISNMGLTGQLPPHISNLTFLASLNIANNSLNGDFSKSFVNLRRLRVLELSMNNFGGRIPSSIGTLPKLEILSLGNNRFSEFIPPAIFNISTLELISLSQNNISGNLPPYMCQKLPRLWGLFLSENQITGELPPSMSNCSALELVSLSIFHGSIPKEIGNLKRLQQLYLGLNMLTDLHGYKSILTLDLSSNRLFGSIPKGIGNLTTLKELYLSFKELTGEIPEEVGSLDQLKIIESPYNSLYGAIPIGLFNISSLNTIGLIHNKLSGTLPTNFELQFNKFSGSIPKSMGNLRELEWLNLQNNYLTKESSTPELDLIDSLTNCNNLRELYVGQNPLNATLPQSIGNLSVDRIYLVFSENELTGQIPTTIGGLKQLQRLYLQENKLKGPFPSALCELTNLGILSMGSNKISGSIPKCIGNVPSLREIDLRENRLSSTIPESLWNLKDVLKLNLSHNSFIGSLSSEISSLRAIIELDLSNNLLSGKFLGGMGDLLTLTYLSISHNGINGSIPDMFVKLVALEHLDLSSNNLSGMLPKSIEKLKFLTFFNVSSNELGGQIPEGFLRNFRAQKDRNRVDPSLEVDTSKISYLELRQATNGFNEENLIGAGGFGSVYKATLSNREVYAVKVFHSQHEGAFTSFERECEVLRNIRHRNIAKVITPVVHCDLKPSNVLIDSDMVGHVTDFGISRLLGDNESFLHTITLATIGYMAPEYGTDGLVSTKCDVYSFGIMLLEVFTRKKPSDEMFNEGSSLRSWVSDAASGSLFEVIDTTILQPDDEFSNKKLPAAYAIIELGLNCSLESQVRRPNMNEALATLKKIKHDLI